MSDAAVARAVHSKENKQAKNVIKATTKPCPHCGAHTEKNGSETNKSHRLVLLALINDTYINFVLKICFKVQSMAKCGSSAVFLFNLLTCVS